MHSEISDLFYSFVEFLRSLKTEVIDDLNLQNTDKYYNSWRNIRLAEATNVHLSWLNSRPDDYSPEVKEMLVQGKSISAVNYIHSLKAVIEIRNEILAILSNRKIDAIVVPTTIVTAPRINDSVVSVGNTIAVETRQALLQNTIVFNSTGLPAISIPIGVTKDNLPIGAQIIGPPFREEVILSIAYCYESIINSNNLDRLIPQLL
jgi:aspartyl-tRNA(Asn)/glutamyl-tRNA(Gln) amidotransferase subunit A